jgi:hypothetical protein
MQRFLMSTMPRKGGNRRGTGSCARCSLSAASGLVLIATDAEAA